MQVSRDTLATKWRVWAHEQGKPRALATRKPTTPLPSPAPFSPGHRQARLRGQSWQRASGCRRTTRESQRFADHRGEGAEMPRGRYLVEAVKDAIWVVRAYGGSGAEIRRRLGLPKRSVSNYLERVEGSGRGPVVDRSVARLSPSVRRSRAGWPEEFGPCYRVVARALPYVELPRIEPLRRPWSLSRPRGRRRGVASGATPETDDALALSRAACARHRAARAGSLPAADLRLAATLVPGR